MLYTENKSNNRTKILRGIISVIRMMELKVETDRDLLDMAAFIVLSLENVIQSIETTALAWEKRDYWVKADKFRSEWQWASNAMKQMRKSIDDQDYEHIAMSCIYIAQNLANVHLPEKKTKTIEWSGAYQKYIEKTPGKV